MHCGVLARSSGSSAHDPRARGVRLEEVAAPSLLTTAKPALRLDYDLDQLVDEE